ncbi:hypothetical protein RYR30_002470 [Flavobacterium psychrophilum]|nr:hypothetical protein [Flavobacterium psychrophilum]ELM3651470.1 hypothetical protein [Flavobacterium psychrophilum]ELM3672493.1 hypothetical protein [Flavobacterium psychrophilum]ELM3727012.1 hypothetical protein [Flavobacterium psychrophilum]
MKSRLILLLISTFLFSCEAQINRDLKIKNEVNSKIESNQTKFTGTRISIQKPNDYELIDKLLRIQKNQATYIQVFEVPNSNFQDSKSKIAKNYEDAISSGNLPKEFYKKEFKLNGNDAIIYYGADKKNKSEQIALGFGDNEFSVIVYAVFPENEIKIREEILKTIFTIKLNKKQKTESQNLQNFTLDTSKTEFVIAGNMSQMFVYNLNGKIDPNNVFENQIIVSVLPKADGKETLKKYSLDMIQKHKNSGIAIANLTEKEILSKNYFGYEIYFEGNYNGKSNIVYQLVIGNENGSVNYCGIVYDRKEELMKQVKLISKTLKLK